MTSDIQSEIIVPGGDTGQQSIYNGLCAAKEIAGDEATVVLIHDGVRPLINIELLSRNTACVKENGSSITTGIVKETLLVVNEKMKFRRVSSEILCGDND